MNVSGAKVLITGGARVGQTVAQQLIEAGAQVLMTYRESPDEVHPQAQGYPLEITDEQSIGALFDAVRRDHDHIDALVNMVSVFSPDGEHVDLAHVTKLFTINAFGNMLMSRRFAEAARERGAERAPIVSFIDWAIDHPYAHYDTYLAAKAALRHYLMALQTTFAGTIRVVNIHPGMILEPPDFPAEQKESIRRNTPTKNIGTPEQAAELALTALQLDFLADNINLAGGQQWRHRLRES